MPFKELSEGQTHHYGDGHPEHTKPMEESKNSEKYSKYVSKCCGVDVTNYFGETPNGSGVYYCSKCEMRCKLIPAEKDSDGLISRANQATDMLDKAQPPEGKECNHTWYQPQDAWQPECHKCGLMKSTVESSAPQPPAQDWREQLANIAEKYCNHDGKEPHDCLFHELEPIIASEIVRAEKLGIEAGSTASDIHTGCMALYMKNADVEKLIAQTKAETKIACDDEWTKILAEAKAETRAEDIAAVGETDDYMARKKLTEGTLKAWYLAYNAAKEDAIKAIQALDTSKT